MKKGDMVTVYVPKQFDGNEWTHSCFEAKVMCVVDGFAMLRRPHCMPFVESVNMLEKWQANPPKTVQP